MSGPTEPEKSPGKGELFDVRELVANDPELPKGFLPPKRATKAKPGRRHPNEKPSRKTSSKAPTYLIIFLVILGSVIFLGIALFVLIRHILPPFQ